MLIVDCACPDPITSLNWCRFLLFKNKLKWQLKEHKIQLFTFFSSIFSTGYRSVKENQCFCKHTEFVCLLSITKHRRTYPLVSRKTLPWENYFPLEASWWTEKSFPGKLFCRNKQSPNWSRYKSTRKTCTKPQIIKKT